MTNLVRIIFISLFTSLMVGLMVSCSNTRHTTKHEEEPPCLWIYEIEPGYITGEGIGNSITEAKEEALKSVRTQIIGSVAQNINGQTSIELQNSNINSQLSSIEKFKSIYSEQTSSINLNGISLLNVVDYCHRQDLSAGKIRYWIKYPFSEEQLQELIEEWKKIDQEITDKIKTLCNQERNYTLIESYIRDIEELTRLETILQGSRKDAVVIARQRIVASVHSMRIVPVSNQQGIFSFKLMLGSMEVSTYQKPEITSSCASIGTFTRNGFLNTVTYDCSECTFGSQNFVLVKYKLLFEEIGARFFFDITENKINVTVPGPILLSGQLGANGITNIKFLIHLFSEYSYPFIVESIEITPTKYWNSFWTGSLQSERLPTIIFHNIDQEIKGKGEQNLYFLASCNLSRSNHSSKEYSLTASGTLFCRSKQTGERFSFQFRDVEWRSSW